jgi:hypothetical protein
MWSKEFQASGGSLAVDWEGNLIVMTRATADIDLGSGNIGPLGTSTTPDLVVAKLDTRGDPIWARRYFAAGSYADLAVDAHGNVWVTGALGEATDFGGGYIDPAADGYANYLLELDPNGRHLFSSGMGVSFSLHAAPDGGMLLVQAPTTGATPDDVPFLTVEPRPPDFGLVGVDSLAARLGPSREQLWTRRPSRLNISLPEGVSETADNLAFWDAVWRPDGSVDLFGSVWREYPSVDLTTTSEGYLTLENVDANGQSTSLRELAENLFSTGQFRGLRGLTEYLFSGALRAQDSSGALISAGVFTGTVEFGGAPLTSTPSRPIVNGPPAGDLYLVKFDATLAHVWSRSFGGADVEGWSALAVDSSNNILVTGSFDGVLDLGGGELSAVPGMYYGNRASDIFVAKLDAFGGHVCSRSFGDSKNQAGGTIAVDHDGNSFVLGHALSGNLSENRMFLKKLAP